MQFTKELKLNLKASACYAVTLLKWLVISSVVGILGGLLGSAFHISVDIVTHLRMNNKWIVLLLPVGGIIITAMYRFFHSKGKIDTNRVLLSVRDNENVPLIMVPLIFVSTVITHMLGGSAGREGAALQLGGGLGYNLGKLLRLKKGSMRLIVMAGMSSVFSALFGTPLTAAVFSLEAVTVGSMNYAGLLPCVISAICAFFMSKMFGIEPVRFADVLFENVSLIMMIKVIALSLLCAVVSILFCTAIHGCEKGMKRLFPNNYVKTVVGAALIVVLTVCFRTMDYNGAGMEVITSAISGEAKPFAFLLKIIFTAITISAGFKGGEIVPAFFTGSTFGCMMAPFLGLDSGFGASIGFVTLFCGVVNCPIASLLLALEVFGAEGLLFFAVACAVSYMMSGCFGLYKSQKIVYSKLDAEQIDVSAR